MMVTSASSARIVDRYGTKVTVATGLATVGVALVLMMSLPVNGHYVTDVMWRMMLMAAGMGLVMAPATESIMGSLPLGKAGVGSAVNDTTRQVGGALGVAIIGSVMSSVYQDRVAGRIAGQGLPHAAAAQIRSSLGGALEVAQRAGGHTGVLVAAQAKAAFVDGLHLAVLVGAVAAFLGAFIAAKWLPARAVARVADVEAAGPTTDEVAAVIGAPALVEP
jgi:hypothetical protein